MWSIYHSKLDKRITDKGKEYSVFFAFVLFMFTGISTLQANEQSAKKSFGAASIGVVNVTYIMEHAPQAEVASNKLKIKFSPQEQALARGLEEIQKLEAALEKGAPSLSVEERRQKEREIRARKRSRSRALQDFREELRFARDSALDDVQKEVFQAIDAVRKKMGIDIILQDYVSASARLDITQFVLAHLKEKLEQAQQTPDQETQ